MTIDGHWKGHFSLIKSDRPGDVEKFPTEAWIESEGGRVSGRMRDAKSDYKRTAAEWNATEGGSQFFLDRIRNRFVEKRHPANLYRVILCRESTFRGTCQESRVFIWKTYNKPCQIEVISDRMRMSIDIGQRRVIFCGQVDPSGSVIEGKVQIRRELSVLSLFYEAGTFRLSREDSNGGR